MSTDARILDRPSLGRAAVAPVTGWRRAAADWLVVGGSTAVCHVIGAGTSLLLRFALSPAQMGIWQTVRLMLTYANYANLGVSEGAARDLAIAQGNGRTADAHHKLNLAFTVNTISSVAYAVVLVVAGVWMAARDGGVWSNGWALALAIGGLLAVLSRYQTFHVAILRSQQSFGVTSRLAVLEGVLTLAVAATAAWCWGLVGLYAGTLVVMSAAIVFVVRRRGANLHWAWDTVKIVGLIGVGGPILLITVAESLFQSLDKLMILAYLGDREYQLGCYSIALMVAAQLLGLGMMLAMVMAPRYGEMFGASGSRRAVARLAARASELQAAAMALLGALSIVAAPPLLGWLLPDYRSGAAAIPWLVPGAMAMTMTLPASHYLVAVNRQRRALAAVLAAMGLAVVGNHVALTGGHGLVGVAAATSVGYFAYWIFTVGVSLWGDLAWSERRRYLIVCVLMIAVPLAVALWRAAAPSEGSLWGHLTSDVAAVGTVWAVAAAAVWHTGWRR